MQRRSTSTPTHVPAPQTEARRAPTIPTIMRAAAIDRFGPPDVLATLIDDSAKERRIRQLTPPSPTKR